MNEESENHQHQTTDTCKDRDDVNTSFSCIVRDDGSEETNQDENVIKSPVPLNTETSSSSSSSSCSISPNPPFNPCWTRFTDRLLHHAILNAVTCIALIATKRPRWTLSIIAALSLVLLVAGYNTNFELSVEEFKVFAPFGVRPRSHRQWIEEESGFPPTPVPYVQLIHSHGDNVVSMEGIHRVFDAYEAIAVQQQQQANAFSEFCTNQYNNNNNSNYDYKKNTCQVISPIRFWNYSRAIFEESVETDEQLAEQLAGDTYPDGTPVDTAQILGNHKRLYNNQNNNKEDAYVTAQCYLTTFLLPENVVEETLKFEEAALEQIFPLRDAWNNNPTQPYALEVLSERSYAFEFQKGIVKDLPLVPLVFVMMAVFTCLIFWKRHAVQSRVLLGLGAVVTIVCSLCSGYGLMFLCGVPFTNLTLLVPFVIFGVGLDDTFVLAGAFARTDPGKSMEERICDTMKDVGKCISVTTLTTAIAFGLGSISNIPAVRWLCIYSMTTIIIDFIYQITFFVALLTLDERRIKANRRDCCVCLTAASKPLGDQDPHHEPDERPHVESKRLTLVDRIMIWYSNHLLHPWVRLLVLVFFTVLFLLCAWSSSFFRQEFEVSEFVPSGSYVISFMEAFGSYSSRTLPMFVYFRHVNQTDDSVRQQMISYTEELASLEQISDPAFCWVIDFQTFLQEDDNNALLGNLTFNEQVKVLLANPTIQQVYGDNIVMNDAGEIVASRCLLFAETNMDVVQDQLDLLHAQEEVSRNQPLNEGSDWAFFLFDYFFLTWEFYDTIVREFIVTTAIGVVAVTAVSFISIPNWTASLFVLPMIGILYVDLIGVIQFCGLHINVVTYVSLAMAIGLLVDYIVHILLRYFESKAGTREERVKDTLRTIGAAVLSGGLSTLIGVIPLAFSSSEVMRTVFICFLAMVALGCSHGLIFLPVLLSYVGPENAEETTGKPEPAKTKPEPAPSAAKLCEEEEYEEVVPC